jgi:hypothetical protein
LFYQYVASLHSMLGGKLIDQYGGIRGVFIPFINKKTGKPYQNIFEVINAIGIGDGDYVKDRNTLMLCVNPILALGPGEASHSTSSSIEYFLNCHSVAAPNAKQLAIEMLVLLGMPEQSAKLCADEWYSLYSRFYRFANPQKPNGGMLALSMSVEDSLAQTLVTHGGSSLFSEAPSIIKLIAGVQKAALSMPEERNNFWEIPQEEQEKIKALTSEARLFLGGKFSVKAIWHYDLSSEQKALFDNYWDDMVKTHLFRLAKARTLPIAGTILTFDPERSFEHVLEDAYREIAKASLPSPAFPTNVLSILIGNGYTDVIDSYFHLICRHNAMAGVECEVSD